MDDRAVSRVLSYIMTLAISTVLVGGLLMAGGSFVDDQRSQVVDSELEVVGQRLAADVSTADRLVRMSDGDTTVRITSRVPPSVAGENYYVEVVANGGNASILIETPALSRSVTVPVSNTTTVAPGSVRGGDIVIHYDAGTDRLAVSNE